MAENGIWNLLRLAGVPASDEKAAAWWLRAVIDVAKSSYQAAKKRPRAADHNDLLGDIGKKAKELAKRIQRLRQHPFSWHTFWRSSVFGPVHLDLVKDREVLSTLENIVRAADTAKDHRKGRRREVGKQRVVDLAFAFFVRYSPHSPSGTASGEFATFARAFYACAIGVAPEKHGGLDRQIRQAMKALPIQRQRAQQMSIKIPRDLS